MDKKILEYFLKKPHFVLSLVFVLSLSGIAGLFSIKQKLFPDANRPQVAVVIIEPGASAKDIAQNITIPVEEELYTVEKIRKVSSTTKDEVTVITAEFEYGKSIGEALTDVQNCISRIKTELPRDILEPKIYKITDATPPVLVIGISPKDTSIPLADVRQIVENQIKRKLLVIPEVSNVDVFGGYKKEIFIQIDKNLLNRYGISIKQVIEKIQESNLDIPVGLIQNNQVQILLKSINRKDVLNQLNNIQIKENIKLSDIAQIKYSYFTNKSLYYGNGKPAIALAVQRKEDADTLKTIQEVKKVLLEIKKEYPALDFSITDTQEKIIKLSNLNMLEALRDAIIMVSLVILFFLSNIRQMLIAAVSIPFVYSITIGIMWFLGIEFNIVTLTGIILALGMLIDDAVVILENVERHLYHLKKDRWSAVIDGTKEVLFPVLAGTISTVVVLLPLLFIGGYPEKIFRPLALTLIIAVVVSYFVSVFFIPLIAPYLLKRTEEKNFIERYLFFLSEGLLSPLKKLYTEIVQKGIEKTYISFFLFVFIVFLFVFSLRAIMPLVGREIMPPMDTGIVKAKITADSNLSIEKVEEVVKKISLFLRQDKNVEMFSISVGSEPGVLSMGKGESPQSINMTVHYVDRFHRKKSIWEIEEILRKFIWTIPGIKYVHVFDYGATPLSTIKGNLDVTVYGDNLRELDKIGSKLLEIAYKTKGLTSVSRSWDYDKLVYNLKIDYQKAAKFGLTPYTIANQISSKISGRFVSFFNVPGEKNLRIRVIYPPEYRKNIYNLQDMYIDTPSGRMPLIYFASVEKVYEPTIITREKLQYTVDIIGYREKAAISHIVENFQNSLKKEGFFLPAGYTLSHEGDIKQLNDSMKRMLKAIAFGIVLLFFTLAVAFSSFLSPISVIFAIPLSVIGGAWSILLAGYHQSMPGLMGIILLAGIITKNSILLIDFIKEALEEGKGLKDAVIDSIKIRTRPVLMTAFGTAVGMIPIAFGWALGLERLAPLGVVAIGGLIVGTFLTLVYVPLLFFLLERLKRRVRN